MFIFAQNIFITIKLHFKMAFELPTLPYEYNALEPNIDARTMEIHYSKHHQGYVNNLNKLTADSAAIHMDIAELNSKISEYSTGIRNNAGGHYNHSLFWTILSPNGGEISTDLLNAINDKFGDMDTFKAAFNDEAAKRFGSGWAWLAVKSDGSLFVCSTPNQDNPAMDVAEERGTPILGIDVWEHAYYLNYQNRRADYISSFWNIINWNEVNQRFADARK